MEVDQLLLTLWLKMYLDQYLILLTLVTPWVSDPPAICSCPSTHALACVPTLVQSGLPRVALAPVARYTLRALTCGPYMW